MPVSIEEFERYRRLPSEIKSFLKKNRDKAFTEEEIAKEINVSVDDVERVLYLPKSQRDFASTTLGGIRYFAHRD